MRNLLIPLVLLFPLLSIAQPAAVPARRNPVQRIQPDGDTLTILLRGDEHNHWTMTADGYHVRENKKGVLCYLQSTSDTPTRSPKISRRQAHNANHRTKCEQRWLTRHGVMTPAHRYAPPRLGPDMSRFTPEQIDAARKAAPRSVAPRKSIGTRLLPPKGLIILVNFSDVSFTTPVAEIDSMFCGKNYTRDYSYMYEGTLLHFTSQGSAEQYFRETSLGKYTPSFQVVGPVTISGKVAEYGGNTGDAGTDRNPMQMIHEACQLADSQCGVNFAQYDANNDGKVDYVFVLYAGYGEADGGPAYTVWPHSSHLTNPYSLTLDGKKVDLYACSCELSSFSNLHDGIGTFCHEFSHVMGLPDIYETATYSPSYKTSGEWDIMDQGCYNNDANTPCGYTAYERFFMGWTTPKILNTALNDTLPALFSTGEARIITSSGSHNLNGVSPFPAEFYLLENRQRIGWDAYIPGHGLLITKVNYNSSVWTNNTVNNNNNLHMDIIEADGLTPEYDDPDWFGKLGDCFPAGAQSYTPYSDYPVTCIKEEQSGNVRFRFMGGDTNTFLQYDLEGMEVVSGPDAGAITEGQELTVTLQAATGYETLTFDNCLYEAEPAWCEDMDYTDDLTDGMLTLTVPAEYVHGTIQIVGIATKSQSTGWAQPAITNNSRKYLRNGHLYIVREGKKYNLLGVQL